MMRVSKYFENHFSKTIYNTEIIDKWLIFFLSFKKLSAQVSSSQTLQE